MNKFKLGDRIETPCGTIGVLVEKSDMGYWGRLDVDPQHTCEHDLEYCEPVVNHEFTFGQRMTLVGYEVNVFYYVGTREDGAVFFTRKPLGGDSFTAGTHGLQGGMNTFIPYVKPEVKPTEYTVEELEELLGKKIKVVSK